MNMLENTNRKRTCQPAVCQSLRPSPLLGLGPQRLLHVVVHSGGLVQLRPQRPDEARQLHLICWCTVVLQVLQDLSPLHQRLLQTDTRRANTKDSSTKSRTRSRSGNTWRRPSQLQYTTPRWIAHALLSTELLGGTPNCCCIIAGLICTGELCGTAAEQPS